MSLTLKLGSLAIRTLAKPLANYIKHNAREHERFRRICVAFAQSLHRIDIRLRLGLLQDPAVIERQIQREVAEAEARRKRSAVPTVKTEAQTKLEEERLKREKKDIEQKAKEKNSPRVRPLSESKAIETGANFISETFLFCVAGGIIVFEYFRSSRKESNRRDEVKDRLSSLEEKIDRIEKKVMGDDGIVDVKPEESPGKDGDKAKVQNKDIQKDAKKDSHMQSSNPSTMKTITKS